MKRFLRVAAVSSVLLAAGAGVLSWRLLAHPSMEILDGLELEVARTPATGVRVRWMGCTTLLFDDGRTQLLVDGFFSRPGALRVALGTIAPDERRIDDGLARAGITRLTAVMTAHSHYDHAMDAPLVALRTEAVLIGSASTAQVARGADFPQDRLRVVSGGERFEFGDFTLTILRALHTPGGLSWSGEIREPLRPPARASAWREGGSFSFHLEHRGRGLLVHPSTNFVPGQFSDHGAEVLFLGTAGLGRRDDAFVRDWWRETVLESGARLVVPIHWDDFLQPLDEPLQPMPALMDDFERGMTQLLELARDSGVGLGVLPLFEPVEILKDASGPGR